MAKGKKAKGAAKRERRERRFVPQSSNNPTVVKALGGVGAAVLGAGAWAQIGRGLMGMELPPYPFAPYLLAGGAALVGGAIWLGTSGEPVVRVGSGGIAVERSELVRVPWHAVERVVWDGEAVRMSVRGKSESGTEVNLALPAKAHPQACAWIAKEARDRIPKVTDVPDEVAGLPQTRPGDGEILQLEPVQVVGKHCAETGKIIAYEPDARVCPQCERVYHKSSVPETCACGASLASVRGGSDKADKPEKKDEAVADKQDEAVADKQDDAPVTGATAEDKPTENAG